MTSGVITMAWLHSALAWPSITAPTDIVKASPWTKDFAPLLEARGFEDVRLTFLNNGTAAVLEARKPS